MTATAKATARAGSNIAFIKYWGVADASLNLPLNNSISMTLGDLYTTTTVEWDPDGPLKADILHIDGAAAAGSKAERVSRHLDRVARLAGIDRPPARVASHNNFPMASGIASSASAFAALSVAAAAALGLHLDASALSALARKGSGSASRSLFGGYVEWERGCDDASSIAHPLQPADHWALIDLVAVVSTAEKTVSSASGHTLAHTSPLNTARIASLDRALDEVRSALATRNLAELGTAIEQDALAMHAVMMTPSLLYWQPATLAILQAVRRWRATEGLSVYFTIDAGPNVHLICEPAAAAAVSSRLQQLDGVQAVLSSGPGAGATLIQEALF